MKNLLSFATVLGCALLVQSCPESSRGPLSMVTPDGVMPPFDGGTLEVTGDVPVYIPCGDTSDCPEGMVCDPDQGVCVECLTSQDCRPGAVCMHNRCVDVPPCDGEKVECPEGLLCDLERGVCVECFTNEDCPEGFSCVEFKCEPPKPPCQKDEDCPDGLHCDPHALVCQECLEDEHCVANQYCDLDTFLCENDVCEPGDKVCVNAGVKECEENGSGYLQTVPCPEGTVCKDGECVPIGVCIPGESYCMTDFMYRQCNEAGNLWMEVQCEADKVCQDMEGHAACVDLCVPDCSAVEVSSELSCGPDGCFGLCDLCPDGFQCPEGTAGLPKGTVVACEPECTCEGKECGTSPCGEWCGDCPPGYDCQVGQCVFAGLSCGEGWECILSCESLPGDWCPDSCVAQTAVEEQEQLFALVQCVKQQCDGQLLPGCIQEAAQGACAGIAKECQMCKPDCMGKMCGDDGCGGWCGDCPGGQVCSNFQCVGGGSCSGIVACIAQSTQPPPIAMPLCLSAGTPDAQEVFLALAECVESLCNDFVPYSDCFQLAVETQCAAQYEACSQCIPFCTGKDCGVDGCGGVCGFCPDGYDCDDGQCACIPDCAEKECGPDGCAGWCGLCAPGFTCTDAGKCFCLPDCVMKECGPDGCGGTCGLCKPGDVCTANGSCLALQCQPGKMDCDGNTPVICAPDGTWFKLPECGNGTFCSDGSCVPWVCTPGTTQCEGNSVVTCDDSGAGWLPPVPCPAGDVCINGVCVPMGDCDGIPEVGCCDGDKLLKCLNGMVTVDPCGAMGLGCGWLPGLGYACGGVGADPSGAFPLACPGTCQPQCLADSGVAKECGSDGCGGQCGTCEPGYDCVDGQCFPVCVPSCAGKTCGADGCGGVCGICAGNQLCTNGTCVVPPTCSQMLTCAKACFTQGDACFSLCSLNATEKEYTDFKALWLCLQQQCAASSTPACVDKALTGACYQSYLACVSCTPACATAGAVQKCGPDGCGGSCGTCAPSEECQAGKCVPVCLPQCQSADGMVMECGDNGCGGVCGVCKPGYECKAGQCQYQCQPACFGKQCGPDGCGSFCGFCPPGLACTPDGMCMPQVVCGDGLCDPMSGESCTECPADCGPCSTGCEPSNFPGCGGCKCEPCVCQMDPYCCQVAWDGLCVDECKNQCGGCCTPSCAGKKCGPDGCGGTCGSCGPNLQCSNGQCIPVCLPDCTGKECGSDDCGGTCGVCPPTETCKNDVCFAGKPCSALVDCALGCVAQSGIECLYDCMGEGTPEAQTEFMALTQCVGMACGFNLTMDCLLKAMAGSCAGEYNACMKCTPDCSGKQCGPDGCGKACGTCPAGSYCDNYKCKTICTPSCTDPATGKKFQCGDNGCGGSCGTCAANLKCENHLCVPVCTPSCAGKQCGPDGCGGVCGGCPPSMACSNGFCIPLGPVCGDGNCDIWGGETCSGCPKDCGPCGDGCVATPYPGCNGCKCQSCVCQMDPFCCQSSWDGLCVSECYECGGCGCTANCGGKECGDDGCGGSCGACPPNYTCSASGKCQYQCQPNCLAKQCGPDGCGGSCGKCAEGFLCSGSGKCEPACTPNCTGKKCGPDGCNGICGLCGPDEACLNGQCLVAWDCEQLLNCAWGCPENDEACGNACWNNSSPEAQQQYLAIWQCVLEVCGPDPQEPCPWQAIMYGQCKDEFNACLDCTPACMGKQCGPDGCNGSCGTCPAGFVCDVYGYCDCTPQCTGKECGSDSCNGSCGQCGPGYQCNLNGKCVCLPSCTGKECGPDGCGGSCGLCPSGMTCQTGKCVPQCVPNCVNPDGTKRQCGTDGCGGQCGVCPPGLQCTKSGQCQQPGPVCGNKMCESGENCLTCPADCGQCSGDCCSSHGSVGCSDPGVTQCVCAMDPFCCQSMWDGLCVEEAKQCGAQCGCVPSCAGKACGNDGCGGQCGACPPNAVCTNFQCVPFCTPQCMTANGQPKECGPDGCGGQCGTCAVGEQCNSQGQCVCVPNCVNKQCGPDGCGGSCGTCQGWQQCTASGQCKIVTPLCGDGNCMQFIGEDCDSCPVDCGACCGNGKCDPGYGETCANCSMDCGNCCGNGFCDAQLGETCTICPQDCGPCPAKCGDQLCEADKLETCDNCPLDCGPCPTLCGDGICDGASENCTTCDIDCGPCKGDCCTAHDSIGCNDPFVQECVCAMDSYCCQVTWDGICADEAKNQCGAWCGCVPTCINDDGTPKQCGDDGCGGSCGTCKPGTNCVNGTCVAACVPSCLNPGGQKKQCGPDGCGGSCGTCPVGQTCNTAGQCTGGGQGLTCAQILSCSNQCGGGLDCILGCYNQGSPTGQQYFWSLMGCVSQACGMPPDVLCMFQSYFGQCSSQYQACTKN